MGSACSRNVSAADAYAKSLAMQIQNVERDIVRATKKGHTNVTLESALPSVDEHFRNLGYQTTLSSGGRTWTCSWQHFKPSPGQPIPTLEPMSYHIGNSYPGKQSRTGTT